MTKKCIAIILSLMCFCTLFVGCGEKEEGVENVTLCDGNETTFQFVRQKYAEQNGFDLEKVPDCVYCKIIDDSVIVFMLSGGNQIEIPHDITVGGIRFVTWEYIQVYGKDVLCNLKSAYDEGLINIAALEKLKADMEAKKIITKPLIEKVNEEL